MIQNMHVLLWNIRLLGRVGCWRFAKLHLCSVIFISLVNIYEKFVEGRHGLGFCLVVPHIGEATGLDICAEYWQHDAYVGLLVGLARSSELKRG